MQVNSNDDILRLFSRLRSKTDTLPATHVYNPGNNMHEKALRKILQEHSKLSIDLDTLSSESDLYEAGLTSLTTVNVMLAIEDHFDVEFEDSMLARSTFQSVNSLVNAVETLLEQ